MLRIISKHHGGIWLDGVAKPNWGGGSSGDLPLIRLNPSDPLDPLFHENSDKSEVAVKHLQDDLHGDRHVLKIHQILSLTTASQIQLTVLRTYFSDNHQIWGQGRGGGGGDTCW